jgi:hypothetical protein
MATLRQILISKGISERIESLSVEEFIDAIQNPKPPGLINAFMQALQRKDANLIGAFALRLVDGWARPAATADADAKIASDEFSADEVRDILSTPVGGPGSR